MMSKFALHFMMAGTQDMASILQHRDHKTLFVMQKASLFLTGTSNDKRSQRMEGDQIRRRNANMGQEMGRTSHGNMEQPHLCCWTQRRQKSSPSSDGSNC